MKIFNRFIITAVLFTSTLFAFTDKDLAISIDLSGKQRMLSQKMTKEAFLIKLGIDKKVNVKKLTASSQLFDKTLEGLMSGDKSLRLIAIENKEIQEQLKKVKTLWIPFHKEVKNIISGSANDSAYSILESQNITLLKTMNKAVGMYAKQNRGFAKFTLANDINLAGKQRMLTQKMGKALLLANNKIKTEAYIKDFKLSRKLFTKTLKGLFNGGKDLELTGTNLPIIVKQLKIVKKLWKEHQPLLDSAIKGKKVSEAIAGLDNILVEMNRAVIRYTQSLNRAKQKLQFSSIISDFMNKSGILKKRVNLSGRQRMLTQRMTKLAILVKSNINKKENTKRLKKFSALYDQTLNAFKSGDKNLGCIPAKSKEIKSQITVIEKKWKPFYDNVKIIIDNKDSDGKSLKYMIESNVHLLKISNELVKLYEKSNKSQNYLDKARLRIVNIAGRQRMLTQKMTKEKLLIAKGNSEYVEKIKKTIKLFDDSLNALMNGDSKLTIVKPTSKKIKNQLNLVADIWKRLKPLYEKSKPTTKELVVIIQQNPVLLKEMNKAVNMSEKAIEY